MVSATTGPEDADIQVSLAEDHHPTAGYIRRLRDDLNRTFPGVDFSFLPADMVGQILNFGLPSPIDVQVVGFNTDANRPYADELLDFSDTAGLIEILDLVISVDTSTAHLAAAMGKPVWIMNRFDTCWRWLTNRDDSPWYPTVRLFRQKEAGNWTDVVSEIKLALEHLQTKH